MGTASAATISATRRSTRLNSSIVMRPVALVGGRRVRGGAGRRRRGLRVDPREEPGEPLHRAVARRRAPPRRSSSTGRRGSPTATRIRRGRVGHEGLEDDAEIPQRVGEGHEDGRQPRLLRRILRERPRPGGIDVPVHRADEAPDLHQRPRGRRRRPSRGQPSRRLDGPLGDLRLRGRRRRRRLRRPAGRSSPASSSRARPGCRGRWRGPR